jgi:hypothetical protein
MSADKSSLRQDGPVARVVADFPASTAQQQFWFMDQIDPGDPALNVAIRWEVQGDFRSENLERAFQHVTDRHEILRSCIVERDGDVMQDVVDRVSFRLATVDIRAMPEGQQLSQLEEIARQDAALPFDLAQPGLLRATLVRFHASHAMLLITAHHAVFDGFSIGVLGREIGTALAAFEKGQVPDLPDLPLQYGDFSMWQADMLASGVETEERAYWDEQLKDAPYFELPTDYPRPARRSSAVAQSSRNLLDSFGPALTEAARKMGVSPFVFGAAVASACLAGITGKRDVSFGTPIVGRPEVDLEALIGPFINTQVLRLPSAPSDDFSGHLQSVQNVVNGALAHQFLPFANLVKLLNPARDTSRAPLVSMNFNLQRVFMQDRDFGGIELLSRQSHTPGSARDLDIVIIGRPGGWRINIEYCPDLFRPERIDALMTALEDGFALAFQEPDALLSQFGAVEDARATVDPVEQTDAPPPSSIGVKDIENALSDIWETVLEKSDLPRDVGFFDLGGHSLLAVRMIAKVRARFETELGVAAAYDYPSISDLAGKLFADMSKEVAPETAPIAGPDVEDDWRIEAISTTGHGIPIIAINEIGIILETGRKMSVSHPSTCIRLFDGTRGIDQSARSFEDIAEEYVKVIKKAQPEGPYILFGVCVHGNIALEAGRILKARGDKVTGIIMKDVWEPGYAERMRADRVTIGLERLHALRNRIRRVVKGRMSLAAALGNYRLIRKSGILQLAVRLGLMDRVRGTDLAEEQEGFISYISKARDAYRPGPLDIPVLHVVTDITAQGPLFAPSIGWELVVTGGLKTVHLEDVYVARSGQVGVAEFAEEIDHFLADQAGAERI